MAKHYSYFSTQSGVRVGIVGIFYSSMVRGLRRAEGVVGEYSDRPKRFSFANLHVRTELPRRLLSFCFLI